ncbi:hypothetical protein HMPREF1881_01387 [Streptococcus agalactiae]|nr:hypothetical protein HMPREF1881_01387 [Streptococcus agalactiae]
MFTPKELLKNYDSIFLDRHLLEKLLVTERGEDQSLIINLNYSNFPY